MLPREADFSFRTGERSEASLAATCCGVLDRTGSLRSLRSVSGAFWFFLLFNGLVARELAANSPILSLTEPVSGGGMESVSDGEYDGGASL